MGRAVIPTHPETGEPLILQVRWRHNPWRVCVTSLLLVATQRAQVEKMLDAFYDRFPGPKELLAADDDDLREALRPLGLANQRVERLKRFTRDWMEEKPVEQCYGAGEYVVDAYRLVIGRDATCEPEDSILAGYALWLRVTS